MCKRVTSRLKNICISCTNVSSHYKNIGLISQQDTFWCVTCAPYDQFFFFLWYNKIWRFILTKIILLQNLGHTWASLDRMCWQCLQKWLPEMRPLFGDTVHSGCSEHTVGLTQLPNHSCSRNASTEKLYREKFFFSTSHTYTCIKLSLILSL